MVRFFLIALSSIAYCTQSIEAAATYNTRVESHRPATALPLVFLDGDSLQVSINETTTNYIANNFIEPFTPVCVMGTARGGKSTLISLLAEDRFGAFQAAPGQSGSYTAGTEIHNSLVKSNTHNTNILFTDTEGKNYQDQHTNFDGLLDTFNFVTSQVVLWNFASVNNNAIQQGITFVAQRLKNIVLDEGQKLGHLIIVCRCNYLPKDYNSIVQHIYEHVMDGVNKNIMEHNGGVSVADIFESVTLQLIP
eukprot:Pgem_evm1s6703